MICVPFCRQAWKKVCFVKTTSNFVILLDDIAYVTRLGTTPLDTNALETKKVFVVHAFPERMLLNESRLKLRKYLETNEIQSYYLPLDDYVRWIQEPFVS